MRPWLIGVMVIMFIGTGLVATANAQTATPTPTPTPVLEPAWVPALFDNGIECPDLDTADLNMYVNNTLTGTLSVNMIGQSAGSVAYNTEYCATASDLSEIQEPYREFKNMYNWGQPGIYGLRFTVIYALDPLPGYLHFPVAHTGNSDLPSWETITNLSTYQTETLCFYYGGNPGQTEIDIDGDCDEVLRTSAAERSVDGDGLAWLTAGLWGQTTVPQNAQLFIIDPEWIIIGEAALTCSTDWIDTEWGFEVPATLGPWGGEGWELVSEPVYDGNNAMGKNILFTGRITSTLTITEARRLVSPSYDGNLYEPHLMGFGNADGVTAGMRLTMADGTEEVTFAGGVGWDYQFLSGDGTFEKAEIWVEGNGTFYVDNIRLRLLPDCPDSCDTYQFHFNDGPGNWGAIGYNWNGTVGFNAPGSMEHWQPLAQHTMELDLTELQQLVGTTDPIISGGSGVTSTYRIDYANSSTQIQIGFTDGTYTTTNFVFGPDILWHQLSLVSQAGKFISSIGINSFGPGVFHDDMQVRLCTYEEDDDGGTPTPTPTIYPTGTPAGTPGPTPTPPPPPDPGDDGFPSPPDSFGVCYDCVLPTNYLSIGQWIRWLACQIRNLFYCSLYTWLMMVGNWVYGVFQTTFALITWVGNTAQGAITWLGNTVWNGILLLLSPATFAIDFITAAVQTGINIIQRITNLYLTMTGIMSSFIPAVREAFAAEPKLLNLNPAGESVTTINETELAQSGANDSKILWLLFTALAMLDQVFFVDTRAGILLTLATIGVAFFVVIWTLWYWGDLLQW